MANGMYVAGLTGIMDGTIDLDSDDIRVILIDAADYTVNLSTHDNLDDVAAGARVATSGALGGKSVTAGVFDANDFTFSAVTGDVSEALILYQHTGTESTSRLICYIDTGVTGLPVTPNGGDINVAWDSGANKIFKFS
jgi:hypothetical protein